ncbi:UPF0280 family protein [Anaeroselena agilis]|uniref:UPF0280 family protein n=1 Tax=Anaeroselena agilis TaxID=3063788 RepID=A0ABU3P427_9FIRM|nr:UPF0280 family protein [Selenomonadales bacterium 4137-cl]
MKSAAYEPRRYRDGMAGPGFKTFTVSHLETDLWVAVTADAPPEAEEAARVAMLEARRELEVYIATDRAFLTALAPYEPQTGCPALIRAMADAAALAGTGPMAAVAGAVSAYVGRRLEELFGLAEVIVENGGDIYLRSSVPRKIAIYAGASPLSNKLAITLSPTLSPLGICTSSGTVGHSLSLGKADAATVLAKDAATADAYATALGNRVQGPQDIDAALAWAAASPEVLGAVVIAGDKVGAVGDVELAPYCGE